MESRGMATATLVLLSCLAALATAHGPGYKRSYGDWGHGRRYGSYGSGRPYKGSSRRPSSSIVTLVGNNGGDTGYGGSGGHLHVVDSGLDSGLGLECRYYCRTPTDEPYCCERSSEPVIKPRLKGGICPAPASLCSPNPTAQTCSNDAVCPGILKCCFDSCRKRHQCTHPELY